MEAKKKYIKAEIRLARNSLKAGDLLHQAGLYRESIPKSYYAMFHSLKALFTAEDIESSKHSFITSEFGFRFIKQKGEFDKRYGRNLHKVFEYREMCDYKTMFEADETMSEFCKDSAREFVDEIERYLKRKGCLEG
ncbi:HEPN domain-containing protein [bacterium]|nr:HEPN domain-containing protein [bacterium]